MTEITLDPLEAEAVENIITTAMSSQKDSRTKILAELCRKRTNGNPFFIVEFLKMLEAEGTDEKVAKIAAAYLGPNFKERTLAVIWATHGKMMAPENNEPLSALLESLIQEKFFEKSMDGSTIRWVHDKLQEAALGFRGDVSASIKFDIGTTLYYRLRPKELEDDLFNVADLINNGNLRRRPDFATMNMKAAEKARCISAFESARNYAIHGLRLLSDKRWVDNRPLTLRLYTLAAEMEMILGNVEMAAKYREDILNYGNFSIMETLPLKLSKAKSLSEVALKFEEAVAYGLAVLKELGCKLVLSKSLVPAQAIVKLMLVLSKVKKLDAHSIASIGTMSDPKEKAIASILLTTMGISIYIQFVVAN